MPQDRTWNARERIVYSAAQLVRTHGVAATGVRDVVAHAAAPRGSFQHYFPGGKEQLVREAVDWSGRFAADSIRSYRATASRPTASGLLRHLVQQWKHDLVAHDFQRGCPLMASAAESASDLGVLTEQLTATLDEWEGAVRAELVELGIPARRAAPLATVMISAVEGAIMLSRVRRDVAPLDAVAEELAPLLS